VRDGPDCTRLTYPSVIEAMTLTISDLERVAVSTGAVGFGVTTAAPFREARATLTRHRRDGMSGPLHFTYDDADAATDVTRSFPWAKSIVVFTHGYLPSTLSSGETGPVIARFATRDQYASLRRIAAAVADELGERGARAEVLIDDNRLVDRAAAARAGVGWLGKSTMLLAPGNGPWMLIGSVVTDAVLDETPPMKRGCGSCVACIPACPTGAITPDGLDARLCISTWLQTSGPIPRWIRPLVERRIYGCDDCLTSCPPGNPAMARVRVQTQQLSFADLLALSDNELLDRFNWFYIPHRDPRFLRRNLLVAAGNSEEACAVGPILDHFVHRSSLVRGHAYWALARSLGEDAWTPLRRRHAFETVPDALDELEHALEMIRTPSVG
jgi:epoxyqueuosine reductase